MKLLFLLSILLSSGMAEVKAHFYPSNKDQISLAKHLTNSGAVLFGASWCPYSQIQLEIFGKEAFKLLNYNECETKKSEGCSSIEGFPTWIINGKQVRGAKELKDLKQLSAYSVLK